MKTISLHRHRALCLCAFAVTALGSPLFAQSTWVGPDGQGGDGIWNATNWSPAGTPGSTTRVFFDNVDGDQSVDTTVTIQSGVAARARLLTVQNNKDVTIQLEDTASLTVSDQNIVVGGHSSVTPSANNSSLTFSGPASGSANITATRFYLQDNKINVGTAYRSTLTFTGNLNVSLTGSYNGIGDRSSVFIRNGVNLTTNGTNQSADFYIRSGAKAGNIYDNNLSIQGSSVSARYFRIESLMQVDRAATVTKATGADSLELEVRNGGRLELAGSGIASDALIDVQSGGTLAVGLTNQDTGLRDGADALELNAEATFAAGSFLEFAIFGEGAANADQIVIGESGSLTNLGAGATILLILGDGFTPVYGQEWNLFTVVAGSAGIIGDFNLSQIDQSVWDISRFNAAGGWTLAAIPEPSAIYLTGAIAIAAVALLRRRRK